MANYIFDPLAAATQGFLFKKGDGSFGYDPLTIAVNGILVEIFEEIITEPVRPSKGHGRAYKEKKQSFKKREEQFKLITVKCVIDEKEYIQTKKYKNLKITAKDISVEIDNTSNGKPKIRIFIEK